MKQLFILLLAASALVGCEDKKSGILDPNAKIAINPAVGVKGDNPEHLSAKEIVIQTTIISWWNRKMTEANALERGFNEENRDIVNNKLMMMGYDVIGYQGELNPFLIEGEDVILEAWRNYEVSNPNFYKDTIAYVPNAIIREAEVKIKEAYANKDYKECYRLMDEAFTYTPITGAEWRALKAAGLN